MTAPLVLSRPRAASMPSGRGPRSSLANTPVGVQSHPSDDDVRRSRDSPPTGDGGRGEDDGRIAATATSLAVACLEIFAGIRRSDSISRWVDRDLLEKIDQRAQLRAEVAPAKPIGELGATRTLRAGNTRVCRVTDEIAEVTVIVRTQSRFRAVAIRLELLTTRWTMTALQTM